MLFSTLVVYIMNSNFVYLNVNYFMVRVNLPNSGCLLNIGNGPQSGPSVCNAPKGREVAHHCLEMPKSGIWYTSGI